MRAHLHRADLRGTDLSGAHLTPADLRGAVLAGVRLTQADLSGSDLSGATLLGADLTGARFSEATIWQTIFADLDLSTAQGLEAVEHWGPSFISIDTLYRSHGNIPEVFLLGAGVPDDMITYSKSLVGRPLEYYSCFISYSSKDQEFAERLYADLHKEGVRCWFAPLDIQGGRKTHKQIYQAIHAHERLLLILSVHSMNSEWVRTEIAEARQREVQEQREMLFPVSLVPYETVRAWEYFDADIGKDSAREIREYYIPDFSNWKNDDAYQKAFSCLLHDLKADI